MIWRPPTGAGKRQLRMQPSGAEICTGRKLPSLFGIWGEMAHFSG